MIYCTTQGIQPIFYNNYKWSIPFKNFQSLYGTTEIYIILYITYTSILKKSKIGKINIFYYKSE